MSDTQKVIVMFKDGVSKDDVKKYVDQVNKEGGEVTHEYDALISGFAAKVTPAQFQNFQSLTGDIIESIEPDSTVSIQ